MSRHALSHGINTVISRDSLAVAARSCAGWPILATEKNMETWKGYDAWKTRTPNDDAEHHPLCHCHEDAAPLCVCGVPIAGHMTRPDCDYIGGNPDNDPDCKCDELRADDKADAAEYRADCRADR